MEKKKDGVKQMLFLGFGIGLSWGVSYMSVDTEVICPVIKTDEFFEDSLL